jgi:succinate-semialdehyde dehydrogenase/glutarate-semialdehyde dehydrogenase
MNRYYADQGPTLLADEQLQSASDGTALIRKAPIGALLGIMPWNYPYYQVARFAGPNLMVGNTILLKHAPQCPESALATEQVFVDAGLTSGAYINLFATNDQVAQMIADPRVAGVSVTGSERAGTAVAAIAGANLQKVVLELGGSDAFIVLDTDDVPTVAKDAVVSRMENAGQACNAASGSSSPIGCTTSSSRRLQPQWPPGRPATRRMRRRSSVRCRPRRRPRA